MEAVDRARRRRSNERDSELRTSGVLTESARHETIAALRLRQLDLGFVSSSARDDRTISAYGCLLTIQLQNATTCNVTMRHSHLTELQQAILDFIWKTGSSTAEQIREGLAPHRALKDSTVRTLLRRLEERDYLTHTVDGKVFVYRAAVPPRRVAARSVRQLIDRFWSGSAEQFLVGMVDEQVLTRAQIRKLAAKIKGRK